MYYAFVDGKYLGSARHIGCLKKRVDEDVELFGGFHATIYRGERSYCSRFYDGAWKLFGSEKKNRPALPDWAYGGIADANKDSRIHIMGDANMRREFPQEKGEQRI